MDNKMKKMMERIKERRLALGYSYQDLANKIGLSKSTLQRYETGSIKNLPLNKLQLLANALEVSPEWIIGYPETNIPAFENIYPVSVQKMPLLEKVSGGKPIYKNKSKDSYTLAGTELKADFCLVAKDDSMINARIHKGDIVFIQRQPMVDNADLAAIGINDDVMLKRVYYYPEDKKLLLNAENPDYPPLIFIGDELQQVAILGKAVAFQSDIH